MYTVTHGTFRTPRGRSVELSYREDTNDYNTLNACLTEDEYRLRDLHLSGIALDIGAHIGGVTVALLADNPDLRVVSVEAVPPNVDLLRENVERNGLSERVTILHAAAGVGQTATVRWAFEGNESADHHAFIGNSLLPGPTRHRSELVPVVTLADLVDEYGPFAFAKVDCEGCEYDFLQGPALSQVAIFRGEEHHGPLTIPGYSVTYTQPNAPRGFEAVPDA